MSESASRRSTLGIFPNASPKAATMLDDAGPNRNVTSSSLESFAANPAFSKHAGQSPAGPSAGRFFPQTWQFSATLIALAPVDVT
ncbi:MAG: hypothetical protein NT138_03040 [Planctomycetales bacterium]|nr:hypothetical protein [Planctomycetales bacterium]